MPELPEVETVRNVLKSQILNKQIKKVNVFYEKMIQSNVLEFKELLINETLRDIYRYGKYLFFIFDHVSVMSHLRMEGKYFIKPSSANHEKHEHVEFVFTDDVSLRYHDTRKFGIMKLIKTTDIAKLKEVEDIKKLGKEAWFCSSKNNNQVFTKEELFNKLNKSSLPIKSLILDQSIICGLGNIYADEVLFLSNIHPLKKGCNITLEECEKILINANIVMSQAIECGGTTIRSYTSSLGVTGRFQINLKVHTKEGKPCLECGTKILKTKVGGRGTYFCPHCQKINHYLIGITGSIGTGKSTVSSYLKDLGYLVIDSDEIVHNLYKENKIKKLLQDNISSDIFEDNSNKKQISFKKLKEAILKDQSKLTYLNNLIHPLVLEKINYLINTTSNNIIFIDVPLLFESNFDKLLKINESWCIYTDIDTQIKRILERKHQSLEEIKVLISHQMPLDKKKALSNITIDNSSELCYTYKQIENELTRIKLLI